MNASQHGMLKDDGTLFRAVSNDHVEDAIRQSRFLHHVEQVCAPEQTGGGRFPHGNVAHQNGCEWNVDCNRQEVKRGDGINETFKRPVLHSVPHAFGILGLKRMDLIGKLYIEA